MLHCPLCLFEDEDGYALSLHVEAVHFAQDSPVVTHKPSKGGYLESENRDTTYLNGKTVEDYDQTDTPEFTPPEENPNDGEYLPCPEDDCGEEVLWRDLQEHLDFHLAERLGLDDQSIGSSLSSLSRSTPTPTDVPVASDHKSRKRRHVSSRSGSGKSSLARRSSTAAGARPRNKKGARLGKAELGPYAFEPRMPSWLRRLLLHGAKRTITQCLTPTGQLYTITRVENQVRGIVPVISRLLEDDHTVHEAWLCHPLVQHIFKLPNEGGFCGFRNIQMMLSFILGTQWPGYSAFVRCISEMKNSKKQDTEKIPNVLQLQDMIERAWDLGFNSISKVETGGISGTRKYIGTPEVQALLQSMNIPHATFTCTDKIFPGDPPTRQYAHNQLLDQVQRYFCGAKDKEVGSPGPPSTESLDDGNTRVHCTNLPPLFLQQPGHSLTIVGIELGRDGSRNLLVFDPAFKPSAGIERLLDKQHQCAPTRSPRKAQAARAVLALGGDTLRLSSNGNKAMPTVANWVIQNDISGSVSSGSSTMKRSIRSGKSTMEWPLNGKNSESKIERKHGQASLLLEAYRRGARRLERHREFEMLKLVRPLDEEEED